MADSNKEVFSHVERHGASSSEGSLRKDEESPATGGEDWSPEEEKKLVYVSYTIPS